MEAGTFIMLGLPWAKMNRYKETLAHLSIPIPTNITNYRKRILLRNASLSEVENIFTKHYHGKAVRTGILT